jgi:sugar phosphate isomerase/epimerase
MKLQTCRHLWGIDEAWETVFPKIKAAGFTAIECPMPAQAETDRFLKLLKQHGFEYIPMAFTGGTSVAEHVASFKSQIERAKSFGGIKLVVHSAQDWFPMSDANAYFREVLAIEKSTGIAVAHETHRGRLLFNPWQARELFENHPSLMICADFSHWVCVAERQLSPDDAAIKLAIERAIHVHARVGYEEGPQVPDPRAPEYAGAVAAHEKLWDAVWASQRTRGLAVSTLTPEFGPPGYLHTLPYTNVPVANLWDICTWMAQRQRERFGAS